MDRKKAAPAGSTAGPTDQGVGLLSKPDKFVDCCQRFLFLQRGSTVSETVMELRASTSNLAKKIFTLGRKIKLLNIIPLRDEGPWLENSSD